MRLDVGLEFRGFAVVGEGDGIRWCGMADQGNGHVSERRQMQKVPCILHGFPAVGNGWSAAEELILEGDDGEGCASVPDNHTIRSNRSARERDAPAMSCRLQTQSKVSTCSRASGSE
ncbi:hypothetical protein D1006_35195 [Burkholderia stabilis]|uniref:Uncharacterized protein n=1 Tax=Burkholderia stabilis TaxID=95485 RepID=A0A4Q2A828_9BURK|nr:hypothetical protein D1006_35195 [Burkholderia stabilis]